MEPSSQVLVVVPAYNAESCIETTIRSVIDQSHSLWTLVVVDDGSTDRTAEIAAAFSQQDSRVQVLRLPKNSGRPSVPRNRGLEHAIASGISFDYLAFLDSDDSWLPDKLRLDLDHFRDSPSVEMVHANGILILRNGTITRKKLRRIRTVTGLLLFNHITCSSVILRKSLALERRPLFDEDPFLKAVEDTELWYRLLADKVSCGVVESYQ
ncbi:MAG: glycosyltransferase family 2 protein, partial [Thermoanaerobaculia bacterium]